MGRLQDPAESTFARVAGSWGKQGPQHPAGLASIQRLSWGQPASGLVQPVSPEQKQAGVLVRQCNSKPCKATSEHCPTSKTSYRDFFLAYFLLLSVFQIF